MPALVPGARRNYNRPMITEILRPGTVQEALKAGAMPGKRVRAGPISITGAVATPLTKS